MAARSYLRRIAQPLTPGAPALAPLRAPRAEEARPSAMPPAPPSIPRQGAGSAAPVSAPEPALARAPTAVTPAVLPPDQDQAAPEMPFVASVGVASQSAVTAASPESSTRDRSSPRTQLRSEREAPHGHAVATTPTSSRTSIHIDTIEVRTPPAATPAPAPPQVRPQRSPPAAPAAPLSRSLTWRYGLPQS
jgi:hypothetical protein